jgi:hypothetical protein
MRGRAAVRCARTTLALSLMSALVVAAAAGLAACGGSSGGSPQPTATVTVTASPSASPSPSPSPSASPSAAPQAVTLYFVRDGALCAVERRLPVTFSPAQTAVRALLKGPTAAERGAGLASTVPTGTRLVEFVPSPGAGGATVTLSSRFARTDDSAVVRLRMAQLVYTVTANEPTSAHAIAVLFVGNEEVYALPTTVGEIKYSPRRRWYTDLLPAIFVEDPGLGARLTSPFVLRGSASVFEGSFTAELVDAGGRRIVRKQVQASQGAPGRGRFRMTIPFSTSAAEGTLIVYDLSMEDGSRQDEVRIPVTFAQD